jgi:DNA-directed RNA polymerase specialized sigma subunit
MVNALHDFLAFRDETCKQAAIDLTKKRQLELEMWNQWKTGGKKPEDLRPLLQSFKPLIHSHANMWYTRLRDVPPAAIRAEFTDQFVTALETYDPNKGAQLYTHITHRLKKANRFMTTYQNPGRIPENRTYRIGELRNAETRLGEKLGRGPTQLELADYLKWSPRQVGTLQKEVRKAYPTSGYESDPSAYSPPRHAEILRLLPYELDHEERQVFEYLYGIGGKPRLEPGEIARKLKMSSPKVSRIKLSIADKYSKYAK